MTTFVLILTMYTGYGASLTSVPGFESDAACQAAGQAWIASAKTGAGSKLSVVCVEQKK